MHKKVAILGGGVAGLSAAHELVKRKFKVRIYESSDVLGGKARSIEKPGSGIGTNEDLPGEHGFRFFPGFYTHIIDTMSSTPSAIAGQTIADNLIETSQVGIARPGSPIFQLPLETPGNISEWITSLTNWFDNPSLNVPSAEAQVFINKLLIYVTSCDDRRLGQWEHTRWWDFVEADGKSDAYKNLLARGMTRSLVAMKAEDASTRTIASILWQMLFSVADPLGPAADRVLNAPTNDAWIHPWRDYLKSRGVKIFTNRTVESINIAGNEVDSITVTKPDGTQNITADYYISTVPVEVMVTLLSSSGPTLAAGAPSLTGVTSLNTDWMNGVQYFLNRDVPVTNGHVILAESPWAITVISQAQFWPGFNFAAIGDGSVRGILSVDISDWDQPGSFVAKPARQCTEAEIHQEVWGQLKANFTDDSLQDSDLVDRFLDPAIIVGPPNENIEPLLVNTIGSWQHRPTANTALDNLFLASDYVKTNTDLACMEGANEAARAAVNGILEAAGAISEPPCAIWELREPAVFNAVKQVDQIFWDNNWPHPGIALLIAISSFLP